MGSTGIGRFIYLVFPLAFTTLALIFLVLTLLNQYNDSSFFTSLYYLRINTTTFSLDHTPIGKNLPAGVSDKIKGLDDWYDIGLWNYCSGSVNDLSTPKFCSPRVSGGFVFDPLAVWGLQGTDLESLLPGDWTDALNDYKTIAKWLFIVYIVALVFVVLTFLIGIASLFMHRLSSVVTSILAMLAALFTIAASAIATALYSVVGGFVMGKLVQYGITAGLGSKLMGFTWASSALMLVASFLWFWGCCCHGRDSKKRGHKSDEHEMGVRGFGGLGRGNTWRMGRATEYQRVASPMGHRDDVPLHDHAAGFGQTSNKRGISQNAYETGYEPFRHDHR